MNLYFGITQIISQPKLIKIKNRIILIMLVCIPSNTKSISFFRIHILLNQLVLQKSFFCCKKHDFIFLEGNTKILYTSNSSLFNLIYNNKKTKYIELYVNSSQIFVQKHFEKSKTIVY